MKNDYPKNSLRKMRYRLALDLGSNSLGWAMVRLDESNDPCGIIRAGVRIFQMDAIPGGLSKTSRIAAAPMIRPK